MNMPYQLKDQDTTPPPVDPALKRAASGDAIAATLVVLLTAGLIAALVAFQVL